MEARHRPPHRVDAEQYGLAQELTAHMRAVRGYRWAFSGYHITVGPGFWLSAAYFGDGLFLVDGSRNNGGAKDVDLLVQGFRARVAQPDDPGMLDPALYSADVVYLSCTPALGRVRTKQDITRQAQCSRVIRQGFRRVSIVEFLPMTTAVAALAGTNVLRGAGGTLQAPPPASWVLPEMPIATKPTTMRSGDICPKCGAEYKQRTLFSSTFFGCMC